MSKDVTALSHAIGIPVSEGYKPKTNISFLEFRANPWGRSKVRDLILTLNFRGDTLDWIEGSGLWWRTLTVKGSVESIKSLRLVMVGYGYTEAENCPHGFKDWDQCPDCCH